MSIKTILLAGVMAGALGGVAAADPYYAPAPQTYEPAPGTYQNGYVWVAGGYQWIDGVEVFVPAHWQLAEPSQPNVVVNGGWNVPRFERRYRRERFERRFDHDGDRDDWRFDHDGDRDDRRFDRGDRDDRRFDRDDYGRTARSYRRGSRY